MCDLCGFYPCDERCTGASSPKRAYTCIKCGEGIFEGDKFLSGENGHICELCFEDMSVYEMLEALGEVLETA